MAQTKHRPFVPDGMQMQEFTLRAVLIGLVLTLVLGAANAYLGLRAGITIAATYPAAVVGMALLRIGRGTILEENLARTAGSIGESVAAGAIFTLPAFVISQSWASFSGPEAYWKSTVLMVVGSILGVLFVSLVRRGMVEDPELQFPESVAAAEIHKAGQRGAESLTILMTNIGLGGLIYILGKFNAFAVEATSRVIIDPVRIRLSGSKDPSAPGINAGGESLFVAPEVSPAYIGVGYIIGPKLASLNFAGGVLAWGLLVPLMMYLMGPQIEPMTHIKSASGAEIGWGGVANLIWRYIVRPIAVGGMMVGAAFTLFKMRKMIVNGLARAFAELKQPEADDKLSRTERYMPSKQVFGLIALMFAAMIGIYVYLSGNVTAGVVAAIVMLVVGFFFATVSGSLVGMIGSTNNPISGLTLSTLIIAALLMVALGATGPGGVAVVLGVAAVVCVSSAVAGELLQDFKVGYILGGTPKTIQIVELIAVVCASLVMYWPLWLLNEGNLRTGGTGFGDPKLAAPQAGLMALLADGIVGGNMPWPLVLFGMFLGIVMIMAQVRSPMLIAVGMYLPLATTFAIFIGGVIRWIADLVIAKRGFNDAQKARAENAGVLTASGMIAGEALMGLVWSGIVFLPEKYIPNFGVHSYTLGLVVIGVIAAMMIFFPLRYAGSPDEPAPPQAIM